MSTKQSVIFSFSLRALTSLWQTCPGCRDFQNKERRGKMSIWLKYLAWYIVGVIVAVISPKKELIESLNILGPITLTALFASLLVPFAGLSANERVQKFALQFAIVPLFGLYTVILWHIAAFGGIVLFVMAAGVHVSYWTTSFHSRNYRLDQCKLAFSHLQSLAILVARLNGSGLSHVADEDIVSPLLQGRTIDLTRTTRLLPNSEKLVSGAQSEIKSIEGGN